MSYVSAALLTLVLTASAVWWLSDDFDPESIRGLRVVITGASSELGREIAHQYCRHGARLLLTGRRESRLRQLAAECKALGAPQAEVWAADLFYRKQRRQLIEETLRLLGGLDHLVLNHGSARAAGWWTGSGENMTALVQDLNLNFVGYVDLVAAALPLLTASGGRLGVVTSSAARFAAPGLVSLTPGRFAVEGLFSSLRQELNRRKMPVSVTVCYLGFVATTTNLQLQRRYQPEVYFAAAAPPAGAALAVLKALSARAYYLYYPFTEMLAFVVQKLFPDVVEKRFQSVFSEYV